MKIQNNKIKTVISILLIFSMIASIGMALPQAKAFTPTVTTNIIHTWLYVGTSAGGGGVANVGVGQSMLITAWTKDLVPDVGETDHLLSSPDGRAGWSGVQVNITKPDNTTLLLNFPHSDPVGNNYIYYTPDQVGTYKIYAIFPATWKNDTLVNGLTTEHENGYPNIVNTLYSASTSPVETFTVTQNPAPMFAESPLPNNFWTRPISGASREWYVLTGNKLGGAAQNWPPGAAGGTTGSYYYGTAPASGHILWSEPYSIGGIMDSRFTPGDTTFQTTHYQGTSFTAAMIVDGKIFWSPRYNNEANAGLQVIDLYTGQILYTNYSAMMPTMASIYDYFSPNQDGGYAYLWDTGGGATILGVPTGNAVQLPQVIDVANATEDANCNMHLWGPDYTVNTSVTNVVKGTVWEMLDPWTLEPITYIANVSSSGTQVYGTDGSILYYNLVNKGTAANPNYYCTVWNTSAGTMVASLDGTGYWQWRPAGGQFGASDNYFSTASALPNIVHDGNTMYSQNFSIPTGVYGPRNSVLNETGTIQCVRQDQYMIIGTQGWNNEQGIAPGWMEAIGLNSTNRGQQLWQITYTPPFASLLLNVSRPATFTGGLGLTGVYPEYGVLTWADPQSCQRWVYSLTTGNLLWTSPPENQYEYYGISQLVWNGILYGYGNYGGQIIAYNITTGQQLWNYTAVNVGFESPYGNYPMTIGAVADGMIYTVTSEHHNIQPMYRGDNLRCLNATTGQEIWTQLCFGSGISIADGILVKGNNLDNMIYAYGIGPSATTVSAPSDSATLGSKILITGTVTDQTKSGRMNTNGLLDFSLKGTPAISDASMSNWMEYLFQQGAYPTNATGVPVSIDAIDPNGNYIHMGDVTSDVHGNYALPYTPQVPGTYQITATFAGTNSYGPSSDSTTLQVNSPLATPVTVTPTPPAQSAADLYFIPAIAGLFILIIIVLVLVALMMRKKP